MKVVHMNPQPPETHEHTGNGNVEVIDIWPTIQGEGPRAGFFAVFVRLAGCNLQCPLCDAQYTQGRKRMSPGKIVDKIQSFKKVCLVVITGGEPFRQNITPLVKLLLNTGMIVEIETNGSYYLKDFPYDKVTIICSPKTPKIHPELPVNYYKYILSKGSISEEDGLPTRVLGMQHSPARPRPGMDDRAGIYVQPADEFDEQATVENWEAAVGSVFHHNYRLSMQIQKILGLE